MSNIDETKQRILRIFPDKIDKDDTINRLNQLDWTRNLRMDQRSIFIAAKAQKKPVMTALTGAVDPKIYKAFADDHNIPDEISTKEKALYNTADKVGLSKDIIKNLDIQTERLETKDLKKQLQELILRKESISQKKENDRTKDENDFLESVGARIESIESTLFEQRKLSKNDIEKIEKNIQKVRDYVIELNEWLLNIPKDRAMRYADFASLRERLQEFLKELDSIPDDFEGIELFIPKLIRGRFYRSDYKKISKKKDIKNILQALAGELQDITKEIPKTDIPKIQFKNKFLKKYYEETVLPILKNPQFFPEVIDRVINELKDKKIKQNDIDEIQNQINEKQRELKKMGVKGRLYKNKRDKIKELQENLGNRIRDNERIDKIISRLVKLKNIKEIPGAIQKREIIKRQERERDREERQIRKEIEEKREREIKQDEIKEKVDDLVLLRKKLLFGKEDTEGIAQIFKVNVKDQENMNKKIFRKILRGEYADVKVTGIQHVRDDLRKKIDRLGKLNKNFFTEKQNKEIEKTETVIKNLDNLFEKIPVAQESYKVKKVLKELTNDKIMELTKDQAIEIRNALDKINRIILPNDLQSKFDDLYAIIDEKIDKLSLQDISLTSKLKDLTNKLPSNLRIDQLPKLNIFPNEDGDDKEVVTNDLAKLSNKDLIRLERKTNKLIEDESQRGLASTSKITTPENISTIQDYVGKLSFALTDEKKRRINNNIGRLDSKDIKPTKLRFDDVEDFADSSPRKVSMNKNTPGKKYFVSPDQTVPSFGVKKFRRKTVKKLRMETAKERRERIIESVKKPKHPVKRIDKILKKLREIRRKAETKTIYLKIESDIKYFVKVKEKIKKELKKKK